MKTAPQFDQDSGAPARRPDQGRRPTPASPAPCYRAKAEDKIAARRRYKTSARNFRRWKIAATSLPKSRAKDNRAKRANRQLQENGAPCRRAVLQQQTPTGLLQLGINLFRHFQMITYL